MFEIFIFPLFFKKGIDFYQSFRGIKPISMHMSNIKKANRLTSADLSVDNHSTLSIPVEDWFQVPTKSIGAQVPYINGVVVTCNLCASSCILSRISRLLVVHNIM